MKGNKFRSKIQNIFKKGIQEYGTRYFCQSKLVYHHWSLGYSKEECYEAIRNWYLFHDHQSKDWKDNRERVLRQLRSAINSLYRNAEQKGYQPYLQEPKCLRLSDVRNILQMSKRDYRAQKFLFDLLEFSLNMKDSRGEFKLPKKVIIKFDCCSNTSYQEKIKFCESIGLITKVREYYRQDRRAAPTG